MIDFCDNEEWLAAYLDRRLFAEERRLYETHIARCPRCLASLMAAKRELDEMAAASATPEPVGSSAPGRRRGAGALGGRITQSGIACAALAASIAFFLVLARFFLSPAWDPELVAVRDDVESLVAAARLGDLQLAGVAHAPVEGSRVIRGAQQYDPATFDRLEGSLNRLIRRYPAEPDLCNMLGHLHLAASRLNSAEAAYRRAAHCAPGDGRALNNLAVVLYRRGESAAAMERLLAAAKMKRVPREVYFNLGVLCRETGRTAEARVYLERYIDGGIDSPWTAKARSLLAD